MKKTTKKTAKKTTRSKAKKKAPATEKAGKPTRMDCACDELKALRAKTGKTIDELAAQLNAAYVEAGGKDNLKQSLHLLRVILPAAENFGIVRREGDTVYPA
jgi:DNA-binding transcriptional regulator YiaG